MIRGISRRRGACVAAAALAVLALTTGLAGSAFGEQQRENAVALNPDIVHGTPEVPVIVDGVRYEPAGIHKFDGRELYFILDLERPDELLAFTQEADFRAAAEIRKAKYDASVSPTSAGQYAVYYSADELRGDWLRVDSAWGINHLVAVPRGCGLFGCAGNWDNVISSVEIHGYQFLYADPSYGGGYFWASGNGWFNLSPYGFDNIGTSLNVWW